MTDLPIARSGPPARGPAARRGPAPVAWLLLGAFVVGSAMAQPVATHTAEASRAEAAALAFVRRLDAGDTDGAIDAIRRHRDELRGQAGGVPNDAATAVAAVDAALDARVLARPIADRQARGALQGRRTLKVFVDPQQSTATNLPGPARGQRRFEVEFESVPANPGRARGGRGAVAGFYLERVSGVMTADGKALVTGYYTESNVQSQASPAASGGAATP